MKKVLITGANSYIGTSFEQYIATHDPYLEIETLDVQGDNWRLHDFGVYDAVFHVAGIAHADISQTSVEEQNLYYDINTRLTVEVATKAKECGVHQFVFMSSMIVYGDATVVGEETTPRPSNFYGDSKLQAELGLEQLVADHFLIAILRPPMIYGKGSKGNFPLLAKLAKKTPIFPISKNERSMLYVEHLCEFVRQVILYEDTGVFFPQNKEYVTTSNMVYEISKASGRKICIIPGLHGILSMTECLLSHVPLGMTKKVSNLMHKVFGTLKYEQAMSVYRDNTYQIYDFRETIEKSTS